MPIAFPKPCAHNRRLTASKPLSLARSRAGQSNVGWKRQLCPRHGQQQAPHVSRAPHPPFSSSAPTSGVPSSFTLFWGCLWGQLSPSPALGASKTSHVFNTDSHKWLSLAELAFSQESTFLQAFSSQLERSMVPDSTCTAQVYPGGLDQTRHKHLPWQGGEELQSWHFSLTKLCLARRRVSILHSCQHRNSPVGSLVWDVTQQGGTMSLGKPSSPAASGAGCGADHRD